MINILIVDDDILVAGALKTILETDGSVCVCGTGTDGKDAVSLYRKHKPDVLLMDIRMKEMRGLEASEQILSEFPNYHLLRRRIYRKSIKIRRKGISSQTRLYQHCSCN